MQSLIIIPLIVKGAKQGSRADGEDYAFASPDQLADLFFAFFKIMPERL